MLINNALANYQNSKVHTIKNYLNGIHKVLMRKDFNFGGETITTAKILLNSIKSIVDYHSSFIVGKPVTITGEKDKVKLLNVIYNKGFYSNIDYQIAKNLIQYGNAYEYVFKENGIIKSQVINCADAFPIYEDGQYIRFVEYYIDSFTDEETERIFDIDTVREYKNGKLVNEYNNTSGLPIHYTSNDFDESNIYGKALVSDLICVMDEIEQLLSKMSDSITTLSTNPLGVSSGQRIDSSISKEMVGSVLTLEDGAEFKWATATLDYNSIKLLLDNLYNQFFQIACVPSTMYGNTNIANVSETSLQILYSSTEAFANRLSYGLLVGMRKRLEYISKLAKEDLTNVTISFNYNKPIDSNNLMNNLKLQYDMGAISKESIIRNSPYVSDVQGELNLIKTIYSDDDTQDIVVEKDR